MSVSVSRTGLTVLFKPSEGDPVVDIIFVHGLQGHPQLTWSYNRAELEPTLSPSALDAPRNRTPTSSRSSSPGPPPQETKKFLRKFPYKRKSSNICSISDINDGRGGEISGIDSVYWPKDLLPTDCPKSRIMTWGYDTVVTKGIADPTNKSNIFAHAKDLLYELNRERTQGRPLIFVAHSLGGIVVKEVLRRSESSDEKNINNIVESTRAIVFLGTPHQGSAAMASLGDVVRRVASTILRFDTNSVMLRALGLDSPELELCRESFITQWRVYNFQVKTFQEALSITGINLGPLNKKVVPDSSSSLNDPREHAETIQANHMNMARFINANDPGYRKVGGELKRLVQRIWTPEQKIPSAIDSVNLNQFLGLLSMVDQEKYKSNIPPLDHEQPGFYWIFRNMDFEQWGSASSSQVLWLSGPPQCNIHRVSSYIVDLAKNKFSETQQLVLYFFYLSKSEVETTVANLIHTFLYQIIYSSPLNKQLSVIRNFLHALVKANLRSSQRHNLRPLHFKEETSPDTIIKRILNATDSELLDALESILADGKTQDLLIVIDGIDKVELIQEFRRFISYIPRRISKVKILLTSQTQVDIKEAFEGLPHIEYDKERKECLASLRFDNTRYDKISKEHKGSLGWLWTHEQYKEWSASNASRLLYIQGKPGSGKSTLTKYFKDNILKQEQDTNSAVVADFFYSYREGELQKSHYNMLRSILYNILYQKESFFSHFQAEHRKYQVLLKERSHSDLVEWHYESLKKVLLSLRHHPKAERLYLIIDAVDESDDKDRRNILRLLFELCLEPKDCVIKVFVASRPVKELEHRVSQFHNFIRIQDETKPDISRFAYSCLKDLYFTSFLDRATEYIVEHAQGVFLWVQLVIEELEGYAEAGPIENDVFEFLKSLPTELEDFYKRILDKLGSNERDLRDGIKLFQFVLFARRPLTVAELRHTLGIQDNPDTEYTPSDEDFHRRIPPKPAVVLPSHKGNRRYRIDPMEQRIIHCGGNLLEIKQNHGSSSVQVMHQTVREFFLRPNGYAADSKFKMSSRDAHISISITCIRYLMLCTAHTNPVNQPPVVKHWTSKHFELCAQYLNEMSFIIYVLSHTKRHIADSCQSANILRLVSQFVGGLAGSPAAFLLENWVREHLDKTIPGQELGETAKAFRNQLLFAAARMRFSRVAQVSLIVGAQVEAYLEGKTPLIISAEMGDDTTARLLLKNGAKVHKADKNGWTAVHWSAGKGHEAVVRLLLERNANIDSKLSSGRTALHWAANNGHVATVRLLLDHSAMVNAKDNNGRTALHFAAESGHEAMVQLLLDRKAMVNAKDNNGRTALHFAAESGHEAVVSLLLDRNAIINAALRDRRTVLHLAAKNGHKAVVQLLLDHNVEINAWDNKGRTALHWAAENGHGVVVSLLLNHNADVNAMNNKGRTALQWAAENGREAVVQLLLDRNANIYQGDYSGRTALHWAAESGREAVVQILLDNNAKIHVKDHSGRTASDWAAKNGHEAVVKLLQRTLDKAK